MQVWTKTLDLYARVVAVRSGIFGSKVVILTRSHKKNNQKLQTRLLNDLKPLYKIDKHCRLYCRYQELCLRSSFWEIITITSSKITFWVTDFRTTYGSLDIKILDQISIKNFQHSPKRAFTTGKSRKKFLLRISWESCSMYHLGNN